MERQLILKMFNNFETTPLTFSRFEFKYLMNETLRNSFEKALQPFMVIDDFALKKTDRKYFVRSLYFDDHRYSSFHDKIDGLHSREKFRIRTYSKTFRKSDQIFLELKGRYNNLVFKERVPIELSNFSPDKRIQDFIPNLLNNQKVGKNVIKKFTFDYLKKDIVPVGLVDYLRRPYFSKLDRSFRVSFDDNLFVSNEKILHPKDYNSKKAVKAGASIMEIKFASTIPLWFHRLMQNYELNRISISKICCGLETLGLAKDEE